MKKVSWFYRFLVWFYIRFAPEDALRGTLHILEGQADEFTRLGGPKAADALYEYANKIRLRIAVLHRRRADAAANE